MNYNEFRELALQSASTYYNWLVDNDRGLSVSNVTHVRIHNEKVYLYVQGRLTAQALETIRLQVYGDVYENESCCPCDYDHKRGILLLHPRKALREKLSETPKEHIRVISDMRFLVQRVQLWYENHRELLSLPEESPSLAIPSREDLAGTPSDEQYETVCGVLSSPFSYVWGAPGTGKTRYVLANCIMAYLRADKHIYLFAPTNNALEQMLRGLLDVLVPAGIPLDRLRRLGVPSLSFYEQYSEICEQTAEEKRRDYLVGRITTLEKQLTAASKVAGTQSAFDSFSLLLPEVDEACKKRDALIVGEKEITELQEQLSSTEAKMALLGQKTREFELWKNSFSGHLSRYFTPRRYLTRENAATHYEQEKQEKSKACNELRSKVAMLTEKNSLERKTVDKKIRDITACYSSLCEIHRIPAVHTRGKGCLDLLSNNLNKVVEQLRTELEKYQEEVDGILPESILELRTQLEDAKKDLEDLEHLVAVDWENVRVVAMTIDRYIKLGCLGNGNFGFEPSHVFMDEAAYCSLIKGYTLLSCKCPLTLLGDHLQLPPVCEMPSQTIDNVDNQPVFLWDQSAIHIESTYKLEFSDLYHQYKKNEPPVISDMEKYDLTVTYRFGNVLSQMLEQFIYLRTFTSATETGTEIYYIHAQTTAPKEARTSIAEAHEIQKLAMNLYKAREDFAILTPYKRQIKLLSSFPDMRQIAADGKIMTVHASQGREFDTVILSVVDTNDKYFVNSNIAVGRSVLNTAISRTKKKLILVMDCNYWNMQNNQLLGNLLCAAKPYPNGM